MRTNWIAAASLALAAFASFAAPAPSQAKGGDDMTIECPEEGLTMLALVTMARDVTGEPFFFDEKDLKDVRIQFQGKVVVPKAKFLAFFEFCVRSADFVPLETMEAGTRVHVLRRLGGSGGGRNGTALKTLARIVEPAELAQYADRWTLVTTTYSCKNLPARELVTTLQLYFADSATEAVRNVEGTDTIIMTGFAANLAALVKMCDRLDAEAASSPSYERTRTLEGRITALEAAVAKLSPASNAPPAPKGK
jgi:type II secretory pathway component GspD/PulD (secretin)